MTVIRIVLFFVALQWTTKCCIGLPSRVYADDVQAAMEESKYIGAFYECVRDAVFGPLRTGEIEEDVPPVNVPLFDNILNCKATVAVTERYKLKHCDPRHIGKSVTVSGTAESSNDNGALCASLIKKATTLLRKKLPAGQTGCLVNAEEHCSCVL